MRAEPVTLHSSAPDDTVRGLALDGILRPNFMMSRVR
jgi:hypothetical protein